MVIVGVVGVDKKNSLIVLVRFCRHVESILISFSSYEYFSTLIIYKCMKRNHLTNARRGRGDSLSNSPVASSQIRF
jgi:hypothetical protein